MDIRTRIHSLSGLDAQYVVGWLAAGKDTTELEQALDAVDRRHAERDEADALAAREQVPA